jgi:MFS family permease
METSRVPDGGRASTAQAARAVSRPVEGPVPATSAVRSPTVLGIGFASLLSGTGHEMATAAMPGFLTSLGAPAAALGAIEGIADASLSASKLVGGVLADKPGADRRSIAAAGYLVTGFGYGSFAFAGSWPAVAGGRTVAWAARGARSPARDALLAGAVPSEQLGRAFGGERAGDSIGAILGPLLAAALLGAIGFRWLFIVSFLPALGAGLSILFLAKDSPRATELAHHMHAGMRQIATAPGPFRSLLAGVGLYGLGNFSATLLILRATQILSAEGWTAVSAAATAVLLYAAHNAANAVAAYPAGAVADRIGRRAVLVAGIALFAAACVAFAFSPSTVPILAVLFVAVGASTALVETAQGSHAAELLPESLRGRGYGLVGLVDGVGDLVSSVVVGVLWTVTAPAWGFAYAAALSALGALVLLPGLRR